MNGILNLDKPAGLSSARAVARIKRLLPRGVKIGHAGTLDPFATGVLLLLIGKATRLCEQLMDEPKQYEATLRLGATTPTDDPESPEIPHPGARPPPREMIDQIIPRFVGTIQQRPPMFSAVKVGGRRAYELARKGKPVQLRPRPVQIHRIDVLEYAWPALRLRIDCGRGTYIRSLARDLGQALNTGSHLTQLQRSRIGPFRVEEAISFDQLAADGVERHLKSLD